MGLHRPTPTASETIVYSFRVYRALEGWGMGRKNTQNSSPFHQKTPGRSPLPPHPHRRFAILYTIAYYALTALRMLKWCSLKRCASSVSRSPTPAHKATTTTTYCRPIHPLTLRPSDRLLQHAHCAEKYNRERCNTSRRLH